MCQKNDASLMDAAIGPVAGLDTPDPAAACHQISETDTYTIARVMKRTRSSDARRRRALAIRREWLAAEYARKSKIGDRAGCKEAHQELMTVTHELMRLSQTSKGSYSNER